MRRHGQEHGRSQSRQLGADRPAGFRDVYRSLRAQFGDEHRLEHAVMECLGASLWRAQRDGAPPDEAEYLECVRGLTRGGPRS